MNTRPTPLQVATALLVATLTLPAHAAADAKGMAPGHKTVGERVLSWLQRSSPADVPFGDRYDILTRVNDLRAQGTRCGDQWMPPAAPVRWNATLETAARRHAQDMARRNFFAHTNPDGAEPWDRATRAGYRWSVVAENIAAGHADMQAALEGLIKSPGHCRNLMNARVTEMAMAGLHTTGSDYPTYWSMSLARPAAD
jgi:uncharacterized protein YkwD